MKPNSHTIIKFTTRVLITVAVFISASTAYAVPQYEKMNVNPNIHNLAGQHIGASVALTDNDAFIATEEKIAHMQSYAGQWNQMPPIMKPLVNNGTIDGFGSSISADQNWLVAGAPRSLVNGVPNTGRVCILQRDFNGQWQTHSIISPPWYANTKLFGTKVVVKNNLLFIGATGENGNEGSVYIYSLFGSNWQLTRKLVPPLNLAAKSFGRAIDFSGNLLAIGAPHTNAQRGQVYIYKQTNNWSLDQVLTGAHDPHYAPGARFGHSVAINHARLAVGAPGTSGAKGRVYTFDSFPQGLAISTIFKGDSHISTSGLYGQSVAVHGNKLAIGAPKVAHPVSGTISGATFVYEQLNHQWHRPNSLYSSNPKVKEFLGYSVAISQFETLTGAPQRIVGPAYFGNGSAYLFDSGLARRNHLPGHIPPKRQIPSLGPLGKKLLKKWF